MISTSRRRCLQWIARCRMISYDALSQEDEQLIDQLEKQPFTYVLNELESFRIKPSAAIFGWFIRTCAHRTSLELGKRVQAHIVRCAYHHNRFICNLLIDMFGKCGSVYNAKSEFDAIVSKNVFSWTCMIAAYARNGHSREALKCLWYMDFEGFAPNYVTFLELLVAHACLESLEKGKVFHQRLVACEMATIPVIANSLINMYGKCKSLDDARRVFDQMPAKNVISWSTLSAAYANTGHPSGALEIFKQMTMEGVEPNAISYLIAADACASLSCLSMGRSVHGVMDDDMLVSVIYLPNSLINMYSKCGSTIHARQVFDNMQRRDLVTWNSIIGAYARNGLADEALDLYSKFKSSTKLQPDTITFISALEACCSQTYLSHVKSIHADAVALNLDSAPQVISALINTYGKCSSVRLARKVFDGMEIMNVVSWSTIIMVYAQNGHREEALELFMHMCLQGMRPDETTFVNVLFACSHGGLIEDSVGYFISMVFDFGINSTKEHCGCLLDLLGRAGWLAEAEDLMNCVPFQPDQIMWSTLVGACVTHVDIDRGIRAAERVVDCIIQCPPAKWDRSGPYVALSNLFALTSRADSTVGDGLARLKMRLEDAGYSPCKL